MRKFFPLWQKPLLLFLLVFFLPLLCKLLHQNLYEQEKYPLIEDFFPFGKNHFYFSYWYSSCICFANCCVKTFMNRKNIRSLRIFAPFGKNPFYFSYWCFSCLCFANCCVKTLINRKSIHSLRIFFTFGENHFYFSYWCFFFTCFANCCFKTLINRKSIHSYLHHILQHCCPFCSKKYL